MEIVGQVEIDEYCQKILSLRWPHVPKWTDIKAVDSSDVLSKIGRPDVICGGFPCQDISVAGRGVGIKGERSGLWKEMLRIICEVRPRYVLVENVTALLGRGLGVVLGDLATIGYDCEWDCIPASALGAPHQRDRVWIVAYTDRPNGSSRSPEAQKKGLRQPRFGGRGGNVSDTTEQRLQRHKPTIFPRKPNGLLAECSWWESEPNVGRVAHGVAKRVDRLKLLGNGQVVQVVQFIGERIMEFDRGK